MPFLPLDGYRILSLAINLPGPLTAQQLCRLGACVTKVEPPTGDPLALFTAEFYERLISGQNVMRIDLKSPEGLSQLHALLAKTDLFLTSSRPAALERLGLTWDHLHQQYPTLTQVAIVGFAAPRHNEPGHDLTYQAGLGLLHPPFMPRALIADIGGAQQAVIAAIGLLLARERGQGAGYVEVSLADAANDFATPLQHGMTADGGILAGGFAGYGMYETSDGWIAIAALEPAFWERLQRQLKLPDPTSEQLQAVFRTRTSVEWESWAEQHDLPLATVRVPASVYDSA